MDSNNIIRVRWNKNYFSIDRTSLNSVSDLKNAIQKHSQVPADEQLLILKGKVLQDSNSVSALPSNPLITMLGALPKGAEKPIKPDVTFEEDLTQEQKMQILREKGEEIVFGLNNLGNTCQLLKITHLKILIHLMIQTLLKN